MLLKIVNMIIIVSSECGVGRAVTVSFHRIAINLNYLLLFPLLNCSCLLSLFLWSLCFIQKHTRCYSIICSPSLLTFCLSHNKNKNVLLPRKWSENCSQILMVFMILLLLLWATFRFCLPCALLYLWSLAHAGIQKIFVE